MLFRSIENHLTITTMESVTSGLIASLITDTEGASAVFKGAFVTYSNEAKIRHGVPEEIISRYSVYSEETAAAMAKSCARSYDADIGIGVTGTSGNTDPDNPQFSEPGKVYAGIALKRDSDTEIRTFSLQIDPQSERYIFKLKAAEKILVLLRVSFE